MPGRQDTLMGYQNSSQKSPKRTPYSARHRRRSSPIEIESKRNQSSHQMGPLSRLGSPDHHKRFRRSPPFSSPASKQAMIFHRSPPSPSSTYAPVAMTSPREQQRLAQHIPPNNVWKFSHARQASPEQYQDSQNIMSLTAPENARARPMSTKHLHSHHMPIATSEYSSAPQASRYERIVPNRCQPFVTPTPAPVPWGSHEQRILSQYALPALQPDVSCLEFVQTARRYAQLQARIGLEETGTPLYLPPDITKIPGSGFYKVTFPWGWNQEMIYTVNIADVGTIKKEYDDAHEAEVRRAVGQPPTSTTSGRV